MTKLIAVLIAGLFAVGAVHASDAKKDAKDAKKTEAKK
jgi:hypothetical protein